MTHRTSYGYHSAPHGSPPRSVICLGETARQALAESRQGRVLAVFSKAVYLMSEPGRLVWLATEETPMHRRAIRVGGPSPRPSVGSIYTESPDQGLRLGDGSVLRLEAAPGSGDRRRPGERRPAQPGRPRAATCSTVRSFVDSLPAPRGFGRPDRFVPAPRNSLEDDRRHLPGARNGPPTLRGMADSLACRGPSGTPG